MTARRSSSLPRWGLLALLLAGAVAWGVWGRASPVRREPAAPVAAAKPGPRPTPVPDPWRVPAPSERYATVYAGFETLGVRDGLPSERVTTVLDEGAQLWVGTDRGLALREGGAWRIFTVADGLAHPYVTSIAREAVSGDLWISTLGGLTRRTGERMRSYTQRNSGLMNDVVYHVVAGSGLVWAATAAGTSCFDIRAGTWALYDHQNSIMHEPWCYALALGPGRTWIGVWGGGVVERETASGRWREYRDPDGEMELDLLRDDGPIHDVTSFVAYDAGVLWQATYFGLSRYDGRRWRTYLAKDTGLPGNFINHVTAHGRTAWLSTDQGLGVFDGETCITYRRRPDGRCDMLTWRGGRQVEAATLPTAPSHNYILWADVGPKGVWLATGKGLSHGFAADSTEPAPIANDERKQR